jgi:hypothetical protein
MNKEYTDHEKTRSYEIYTDLIDVLRKHTKNRVDVELCLVSVKLFYEDVIKQASRMLKQEE